MKNVEGGPFQQNSYFNGFGVRSADSVVGEIMINKENSGFVLKWNRRHIASEQEAFAVCKFLTKTVDLYQIALGKEFLLPTFIVAGEKKDSGITRYKIYLIQKYVDSWTAKNAPAEVLNNSEVQAQWNVLNSRLFTLYNAADFVNRRSLRSDNVFPITLTVGSTRAESRILGRPGSSMPKTPNLLIDKNSSCLYLCDFGEYIAWSDNMEENYQEILNQVKSTKVL